MGKQRERLVQGAQPKFDDQLRLKEATSGFTFLSFPVKHGVSMKLYCCYTPAHELLFREHFAPTIPVGVELVAERLEIDGSGDFLSPEFLRCIREKIRRIRMSIARNPGEIIVWSDVDIAFCGDPVAEVAAAFRASPGRDVLFQREARSMPDVNTGFFGVRCGPEPAAFFERVEERLAAEPGKNEQAVVNDLLLGASDPLRWGYLPWTFYARTHGWPPPRDLVLYHANSTKGHDAVGQKAVQFKELSGIRSGGEPARLWSCIRRIPGRLGRIFIPGA